MCYQFDTARKRLATSGGKETIICVNGCCYGKSREQSEYKSKGSYYKICCKRFWELISGEPDLYIKMIEPLGHEAAEKNNEFKISYGRLFNRLTKEFLDDFSNEDGSINWEKLLIFNSSFENKDISVK